MRNALSFTLTSTVSGTGYSASVGKCNEQLQRQVSLAAGATTLAENAPTALLAGSAADHAARTSLTVPAQACTPKRRSFATPSSPAGPWG
jgi:hypothetical protein